MGEKGREEEAGTEGGKEIGSRLNKKWGAGLN